MYLTILCLSCIALYVDNPGMEYRIATITGPHMGDNCERARKMIDEIVGEVRTKDLNVINACVLFDLAPHCTVSDTV